jgi:hypothetical protein
MSCAPGATAGLFIVLLQFAEDRGDIDCFGGYFKNRKNFAHIAFDEKAAHKSFSNFSAADWGE